MNPLRPSILALVFLAPLLSHGGAALSADPVRLSADSSSYSGAAGRERFILQGNARLRKDRTLITADRIEAYGKGNRFATCTGNVTLLDENRGIRATTSRLDYDSELKLSRLQGPSVMEDKENQVVIKGSFIENDETLDIVIIQIGVRILKDDMVCRSEYAIYRRGQDKLELTGMPVVIKGENEFRAARIIIDIETNEITLEGGVTGSFAEEAASPSPSPAASPKPSDATPGPAATPAASPTPVQGKDGAP